MSMETRTAGPLTMFNNTSAAFDLCSLPGDVFWVFLDYLTPRDIVCCRQVSRAWNDAFGNPYMLIGLLKKSFPFAREVRELQECEILDNPYLLKSRGREHIHKIFSQVACRYDHLARGKSRSIQKYKLCADFGDSGEREFFPVQHWEVHASHPMRVDCPFSEAFWSYEDGLVVYPSADHHRLVLMDLNADNDRCAIVPFIIKGKVVRRVRLHQRVLVIEWAEPNAFHWLDDTDGVHRHFASSFDVTRIPESEDNDHRCPWTVIFRNEWKIMFLGHPLSERDRFFSSHNKTHYVIYVWQPNRSLYTADEDAPIESLTVWDISTLSTYRPSLDPTGRLRGNGLNPGPFIISRFGFRELGFFQVRQRGCPRIQRLEMTDDAQAIEITETVLRNIWSTPSKWTPEVCTTSIPVTGTGPCWRRKTEEVFPPTRGNGTFSASPLVASGDDENGEHWYSIISEAVDRLAQVRFCLHFAPIWPTLDMRLSIRTPSSNIVLYIEEFFQLVAKGKICGDERFVVGENHMGELVICRFDR